MDSSSRWKGANGSPINARPTNTHFELVPLGIALLALGKTGY